MREVVQVPGVTTPIGPFSVAVRGVPQLHVSGQVAQDPRSGQLVAGDAATQATQIFTNVQVVLHSLGRDETDVLRVGVFLVDIADYTAVNVAYERFFSAPYPARTAVVVAGLPLGALVEVDLVVG